MVFRTLQDLFAGKDGEQRWLRDGAERGRFTLCQAIRFVYGEHREEKIFSKLYTAIAKAHCARGLSRGCYYRFDNDPRTTIEDIRAIVKEANV